jgi:hypothetical protein
MRSCCTALSLIATGLGGYLSAALLGAVNRYTTWLDDLEAAKTSRLDLYFVLLAAVMLMNTAVFVFVALGYKYKVVEHRAPIPSIGGQAAGQRWQRVSGVQPRPGGGGASSAAIPIGGGAGGPPRPGYGYQYAGTPSEPDVGPYGRSVTYMPQTPIMPAHYR